jgi:hypothetical protein
MQMQIDLGVLLAEQLDYRRQNIPGLGMSRGDIQSPLTIIPVFFGQSLDIADLLENGIGMGNDFAPDRSDLGQMFTAAGKELDTQLILQQLDLFAYPRLRGMQILGGG